MKHIYTMALLVLLNLSVSGQFQKGDRFVNGNISLTSYRFSDSNGDLNTKYFSLNIGPDVGYFTSNDVALGFGLAYGYGRNKTMSGSYEDKSHSFHASFLGRKYFAVGENFALTLTNTVYAGMQKFEYQNTAVTESKGFNLGVMLQPGLVFLLSPNWSIDMNLGMIGYGFERNTTNKTNTGRFNLNAGTMSLGWTYYLRASK